MSVGVVRDQADKRQFDGLALRNKKPGVVYRWARRDDFQVSLNRFNGYEVVDRNEDSVESVLNSGTRMKKGEDVDGTITLGDLVLMSIPVKDYDERRKREESTALARQLAVTRAYHSEIARIAGQGVSYESGHYVGSGRSGVSDSEDQRASAAERSSKRDKMSGSVGEVNYESIINTLVGTPSEAQRGGNP
jgi:hypothetical protein